MGNASVTRETVRSNGREYPIWTKKDFYPRQGMKVAIAFNWHLKLFSIRPNPKGKVMAYARDITLAWAHFSVDHEKQKVIQAGGPKSLHAYVLGEITCSSTELFEDFMTGVRYNPKHSPFFETNDGRVVKAATMFNLRLEGSRPRMTAYDPRSFYYLDARRRLNNGVW